MSGTLGGRTFESVDTNRDGVVTLAEWVGATARSKPFGNRATPMQIGGVQQNLAWFDDSRTGKTEKQQRYELLRKNLFNKMDFDSNKIVTKSEFVSALTSPTPSTSPSIWKVMSVEEANRIYNDITSGFGRVTLAKLDGYLVREAVQLSIRKCVPHAFR